MNKIIRADFLLTPTEFHSFAESVSASNQKNSKQSEAWKINGKIVRSYKFNGKSLVIEFNNDKLLAIYPRKKSVTWDVLEKSLPLNTRPMETTFLFEIKGKILDFNWSSILDGFIGKQVAISPSDQYLFIFSKEGPEYIIDILFDIENPEEKFLFISET